MFWLILASILGVLILWSFKDSLEDFGVGVLLTTLIWLILGLVGLGIGVVLGRSPEPDHSPRSYLGNLQDGTNIHGSFFLGSGTINQNPAYFYYKQIGPGQYRYRQLVDDGFTKIIVFTDEKEHPYIKTLQTCSVGRPSFWWIKLGEICSTVQQEFHVPPNSIVRDFQLDAQP